MEVTEVEDAPTSLPTPAPGERKPVTILFADVVDSTSKAEALDPEEWREVVAGAHRRVTEAVTRYEGTVAQILGDGVLAYFGAPVTHEDDPERAVRAAIDIQNGMREYAAELSGYVDEFAMRVGIHAGTVVVGELGSPEHSEYLAVGDAVNVAARLEGLAEPGEIILSEQIANRIQTAYELDDLGLKELKGKQEPLRVFRVRKAKLDPGRMRGLTTHGEVFVGREQELEALQSALLELCRGHGQVQVILGEAGIGKSRLVEELRKRPPSIEEVVGHLMAEPKDIHWLEARGLSYGGSLSFWLITQLLLNDLGVSEGAPSPKMRAALGKRVVELLDDRGEEILPLLSRLLGLKLKPEQEDHISGYDSETLRHETFRAVESYFAAMIAESPVVLVLDDLHWVDASSLEMLEKLLPLTDRGPLMLLALMRPEREHAAWDFKIEAEKDFGHRYVEYHLQPLSGEAARELVERVLERGDYASEVVELILGKAEGNPFYLEELLRHMMERDLIRKENGTWKVAAEVEGVGIPETLQGLVLARLDRLEEDVQHTLQLASVIGRSFLYRLLETISDAENELLDHLSALQRADLVREKARLPELEYMFKHAVTQEAAYHSLLIERRQKFHLRVGQAVEELFADRIEEFYGLLAHHYDAAGETEQAVEYLTKAADKARTQESLVEAKSLLKRLVELHKQSGNKDLEARTWLKLALLHQTNFEFGEAHEAYEMAFSLNRGSRSEAFQKTIEGDDEAVLSIPLLHSQLAQVNLDDVRSHIDAMLRNDLQAGLVSIDHELNVVPDAARSWEVLDDGRRYLFHLRDDLRWNDGSPVVAQDYVRYLLWLLEKNKNSPFLDAVEGVYAFRTGELSDIDQVGIIAVNSRTLEIRLAHPSSHFLYRIALNGFPAPPALEDHNEGEFWRSERGLYSGPFMLKAADKDEIILVRNPYYFGEWQGNLTEFRTIGYDHPDDYSQAFLENEVDVCWYPAYLKLGDPSAHGKLISSPPLMTLNAVCLNPNIFPTNVLEFRRAFAYAVNRGMASASRGEPFYPAYGGVVLPGMPGHSPDVHIEEDLDRAKELIGELKQKPEFRGSILSGLRPVGTDDAESQITSWLETIGFSIEFTVRPGLNRVGGISPHIYVGGWVADYPDPHSVLVDMMVTYYSALGWQDQGLDEYIRKLTQATDRKSRMEIVRQFDYYLVQDQVLVIPILYGGVEKYLVKPWVENYLYNALNHPDSTRVRINTDRLDK